MLAVLRNIASLKLTVFGMLLFGVGAVLIYDNPANVSQWVLVVPLMILAMNLAAAIITNPRINQQPGLLTFHVALLSVAILVGLGRLLHLDAHIEMPLGQEFNPELLLEVRAGPLHSGALDKVRFVQGPYTVNYAPGMRRGLTFSQVRVARADDQWEERVVGDDRPLIVEGYRFYTTHNKGFSPILTWTPEQGTPVTGLVNMPSYPLFEFKQDNSWTPPGGAEIKFWLQLHTGLDEKVSWVLDGHNASGVLVVNSAGVRHELTAGQSVGLPGGSVRFDGLSTWMGYRIFYDPTIGWLFYVSVAGVLGLAHYYWRKINLQPWLAETEPDQVTKDNEDMNTRQAEPTELRGRQA